MKQIFTCLLFLCTLLNHFEVMSAAPTVPSSSYVFNAAEGNRISFSFKQGNGLKRIIVGKAGGPVTGSPVNGTTYNANAAFATTNTDFTATGEFVLADGYNSNLTVTNLTPGTTYYFAIFEYNGTGAGIEYLNIAGAGNYFTASIPASQSSAINISTITGNAAKIEWTKGDGARRLVVLRKDNPVTATPANFSYYVESPAFGNGSAIGTGNYVVYANTGNSVNVNTLEPNSTYHISIFEYNGSIFPLYLKPAATASFTTAPGPSTAPSNLSFSAIDGDRHIISFKEGNGTKRLVIARKGSPVTAIPQNGVVYNPNAMFGYGTEISTGEYVLSNTYNNSFTVTNLEPNSVYHYAIFEFDGTGTNTYYLTSSFLRGSSSSALTPTVPATGVSATNITGSTATISSVGGNGTYRLILMKEGAAVNISPVDLRLYNSSSAFGSGVSLIAIGNYAMSSWSNRAVAVTGLKAGTTYHVAVFEYNGMYHPVYLGASATTSFTTPSEPATTGSGMSTYTLEPINASLLWTPGNGIKRIMVARKGLPVTSKPQDGAVYIPEKKFGTGGALSTDEFVVYEGSSSLAEITNLEPNTTYHIAVFEYNLYGAGQTDYLTSSYLSYSFTTLKKPAMVSTGFSVTAVSNTQATISFTKGDGYFRLGVVRAPSTTEAPPQDYTPYNTDVYGGSARTGAGNFVTFKGTDNSGVITGLQPGTTYTLTVYEFNGSTAPIYLTPGASFNFTTTGTPPLNAPTQAASSPSVITTEGNAATLKFSKGNGVRRIVVMREAAAVSFLPTDGITYGFNGEFGKGTAVKTGEYIVYNGTDNSIPVSGLKPNTIYHAAIFEYNTDGTGYKYLTSSFLATTLSSVSPPGTGASDWEAKATDKSVSITVIPGSGAFRLIAVKEGGPISAVPADLSVYPANTNMGDGSQLEAGTYVVYAGSNNSTTITGLTAGKQYYFSVFEYNGSTAPVYNKSNVLTGTAVAGNSLPVIWQKVDAVAKPNGILISWSTSQEFGSAFFEVERSDDGIHYYKNAIIAAAGNSDVPKHYSWLDQHPQNGTYQYRIRQVDLNNNFSYSRILHIDYKQSGNGTNASVYPNPASSQTTITWPPAEQQAMLTVTDINGRKIFTTIVNKGESIPVQSFRAGLYYLQVKTNSQQYSVPFIKF